MTVTAKAKITHPVVVEILVARGFIPDGLRSSPKNPASKNPVDPTHRIYDCCAAGRG
jgi:hypothetical protein